MFRYYEIGNTVLRLEKDDYPKDNPGLVVDCIYGADFAVREKDRKAAERMAAAYSAYQGKEARVVESHKKLMVIGGNRGNSEEWYESCADLLYRILTGTMYDICQFKTSDMDFEETALPLVIDFRVGQFDDELKLAAQYGDSPVFLGEAQNYNALKRRKGR